MGELDQALFLYLDGQDPSTIHNHQDQRREYIPILLSHSLSLLRSFKKFLLGKILFGKKGCCLGHRKIMFKQIENLS